MEESVGLPLVVHVRRIVAKTLAKQFAKEFETDCSPFQYAPSTRARTDCVGHMLRAATDSEGAVKVLSVDGSVRTITSQGRRCWKD